MLTSPLAIWNDVKNDKQKLSGWLVKQYVSSSIASIRVKTIAGKFDCTEAVRHTLEIIASQESSHAEWVTDLLEVRGIVGHKIPNIPELHINESFEVISAFASHAESIGIVMLNVIVADEFAPNDVRAVFTKILKDEIFHEKAYRFMAGVDTMLRTPESVAKGQEILGIEQ